MKIQDLAEALKIQIASSEKVDIKLLDNDDNLDIIHHFTKCNHDGCNYSYLKDHKHLLERIIKSSQTVDEFLNYVFETIEDHYKDCNGNDKDCL